MLLILMLILMMLLASVFWGSYKSPELIQIYQYICLILIFNSLAVQFLAFPLLLLKKRTVVPVCIF